MNTRPVLATAFIALFSSALLNRNSQGQVYVIDAGFHHLGDDATPDWTEAAVDPEGTQLSIVFQGHPFDGPGTLFITQRSVGSTWYVELNGERMATLAYNHGLAEQTYTIPADSIRPGDNTLSITPTVVTDDITIGNLRYYGGPLREALDLQVVRVHVRDAESGDPIPARVTITDQDGEFLPVYFAAAANTATRQGIVYTSDGSLQLELPPGTYHFYAARGMEWGLARAELELGPGGAELDLALRREVDTTGFIACDTHLHTLTYSGHGDASVEERQVTLAGEGVELAIATDHNHNTDYGPIQKRLGLTRFYTAVTGNEITTPIGHLNGFPLDPEAEVPPYDLHDIVQIVEGIRARGARAVILNHPRWPNQEAGPYGVFGLSRLTGATREPFAFPFDAMELINSDTQELEPFTLFSDWFAILNRGESVMAVGSSDSHFVGVMVGQGRTYVKSATDDPAALSVEECCDNIASGRSSISMGIFADLRWGDSSVMGETLSAARLGGETPLVLHVRAPSWVHPERVIVFANGTRLLELELDSQAEGQSPHSGVPMDLRLPIDTTGLPAHDAWLVCVVTGAAVDGPWWRPELNPYTLAATNPVFLDGPADNDHTYAPPRAIAQRRIKQHGTTPGGLSAALAGVDDAVALQLLDLARKSFFEEAHQRTLQVGEAGIEEHPILREFLDALEEPK